MELAEFAATRGFTEDELLEYGIEMDGSQVRIPLLGGRGTWLYRIHRPNGSPKYKPEREGMGHHLYNPLGLGPHSDEVWLSEGEFDTLSLLTVGAPAVGVLGASGFKRSWRLLFQHARVVVAYDPDSESEEQAKRVRATMDLFPNAERFDPLKVAGYNDINDWFKADRDDLKSVVRSWTP